MKKILLTLLLASPLLAFSQASPGGIGLPAIWLKGNDGVTPNTADAAVTGWQNKGTIPFTLIPSGVAGGAVVSPVYKTDGSVDFVANSALIYSQIGSELSSVLGDGTANKKYEVFIVASGNASASPFINLSGNTPTYLTTGGGTDGTRPIVNHLAFAPRAVFFNNNATGTANGDGEVGYYGPNAGLNLNNPALGYTPNIPTNGNPSELAISHISSSPVSSYTDLGSLVFSVNGYAAFKHTDGTDPIKTAPSTVQQRRAYQGVEFSYGTNTNTVYNLNVEKIFLGGKLNFDGTGLIPSGTTRRKQGKYFEIIIYNRALTVAERQKVYSYLALKYKTYLAHDQGSFNNTATAPGETVGNGETVNNGTYFASDGSIIFKRDGLNYTNDQDYLGNTANGFIKDTYYPLTSANTNNNFSFFGRDDASGLLTYSGTIAHGAYFEANTKNTTAAGLNSDKQFLMLSTNNAATTYTTDNLIAPYPASAGIVGRVQRTWKITSTNFKNIFTFNGQGWISAFLTAAGVPANQTDVRSRVYLLISRDPSFPADGTAYATLSGANTGASFLEAKPDMTTFFGSAAATQQITFYVTFGVTSASAPTLLTTLPVEISSFTAKTKGSSVNLNWSTASEKNASHFIVTRAKDANSFTTIGRVEASANSNSTKNYSFVDNTPFAGINYYQLQQVDFDGKTNPSGVINAKVSLSSAELITKVAGDDITVSLKGINATTGTINAVNAQGQKITTQNADFSNGNAITIKTTAKGLIILTLTTVEGTLSKKIIK